jgi:hypothetical protein
MSKSKTVPHLLGRIHPKYIIEVWELNKDRLAIDIRCIFPTSFIINTEKKYQPFISIEGSQKHPGPSNNCIYVRRET